MRDNVYKSWRYYAEWNKSEDTYHVINSHMEYKNKQNKWTNQTKTST